MTIREITEEIGTIYQRMKSDVQQSQNDGKPMSAEVETIHERNNSRLTDLIKMRDQHYAMLDNESRAKNARDVQLHASAESRGLTSAGERKAKKMVESDEYRNSFNRYLTVGFNTMNEQEQRALTEGTSEDGGYIPTTDFNTMLIEKRFQANAMRQICTVMPLGGFKTDFVIESGYGTASYTAEAGSIAESSPTFGNVVMQPNTIRYFTKISNELLADAPTRGSGFSIESILANQMGRVIGAAEESAFVIGNGSGKPKGLLAYTSGSDAISASLTATAGTLVAQDLINTIYALPRQYRANAKWVFTDEIFAKIRGLLQASGTAGQGYGFAPTAWSMGDGRLQDGEPDRLLGYPVACVSDGNAFAAGNVVGAFGDCSYYCIGDREGVSVKVARETYLQNNQTGFFGFTRNDGKVTLPEAFVHLQIND